MMRIIAKKMIHSISNEKEMTRYIQETWELQKVLHESMESQAMRRIQDACNGLYLAARATGAGGGGCMIFYVKPEKKKMLARKIESLSKSIPKLAILPFKFDYQGITLEKR